MKKKMLSILLGLSLITTAALTGCGTNTNNADQNDNKESKQTNIKFQIEWASDSGRGECIQSVLDEFEKENPNINVELIGGAQGSEKTVTQLLSSDAPDVIQVPYRTLKKLAPQGVFVDLTDSFNDLEEYYYPAIWNLSKSDDRLYGVPWIGHSIQLVYNKTIFDKAGLKAPTNWDELYKTAKALTKDTDGDGKIDQYGIGLAGKQDHDITWMANMFVYQAGGELIKTDENGKERVAINSSEAINGLNMYKKLITECAPPDSGNKNGGDVMADFRNGVVAMELQGPWGITDIWQNGRPFEVAAAEVPAGPAGRASEIGPYMVSITGSVEGEKLEASKKLISFLTSKKGQELILKGEKADDGNYYPFRVPIRKDMADTEYFENNPEFKVFIEGFAYPSISTPTESWSRIEQEIYQSQLNKMVIGDQTAEETAENVQKLGDNLLDQE